MTRLATRLIAFSLLLAFPGTVAAQQPRREVPDLTANGYEVFRAVLDLAKLTPMTAREVASTARFDDVVVVVIGNPLNFVSGSHPMRVADMAVQSGGAALIAYDTNFDITITRNSFTRINGRRVAVTRPELGYMGRVFDPLLVPEDGEDPVHGLFEGLNRVATEHPSHIDMFRGGFDNRRILARFPTNRSVYQNSNTPIDTAIAPFAIADAPQRRGLRTDYRLLVFADQAVFKNSLMAPAPTAGQTDNIVLAQRTVEYLQGPEKHRKRCVFYEDGRVVEDFGTVRRMIQSENPEPNLPNPLAMLLANQPAITDIGNKLLDEVQTRDVHNTLLLGSPDNPGGQSRRLLGFVTAFLVMGSVWAAWFLLRRVWRSRQPTDNPPPPFGGGSVTADRSGGLFDRRKRELVRRNNLYEPIRDALRDLFASAGAEGGPGIKPPAVMCTNEVRKPAKLREAIHDLWKLAYGKPVVVTVRRSQELAPVIERLHREFVDRTWWFSGTRSEA